MINIDHAESQAKKMALVMFAAYLASDLPDQQRNNIEKLASEYQNEFLNFLTWDDPSKIEDRVKALSDVVYDGSALIDTTTQNPTVDYSSEEMEKIESYSNTLASLASSCDFKGGRDQTPHINRDDYQKAFFIALQRPSFLTIRQKLDVLQKIIQTHHKKCPDLEKSAEMFIEIFDFANRRYTKPIEPSKIIDRAKNILQSPPSLNALFIKSSQKITPTSPKDPKMIRPLFQ